MEIKIFFKDESFKIIEKVTMIDYLDTTEPKVVINSKHGFEIIKADEIKFMETLFND